MYTKAQYNAWRSKHRKERKLWAKKVLGNKCARCGSKYRLEFDHIDFNEKEYNITWADYSKEKLLKELVKCQLLCKDCHKLKTKEDWGVRDSRHKVAHGTVNEYNNYKCKCVECKRSWADYCTSRARLKKIAV